MQLLTLGRAQQQHQACGVHCVTTFVLSRLARPQARSLGMAIVVSVAKEHAEHFCQQVRRAALAVHVGLPWLAVLHGAVARL